MYNPRTLTKVGGIAAGNGRCWVEGGKGGNGDNYNSIITKIYLNIFFMFHKFYLLIQQQKITF